MDRISDLPKDILQRILYFLSQKEAVQTSVLSKSWRYSWCTRPNLDFSYTHFKYEDKYTSYDREKKREYLFLSVVDKTLQRYCDKRLSLEELHLCIQNKYGQSVTLLEKLIPLLKNMGLKKLRLSVISNYCRHKHLELPPVVYGAESLQDLRLEGFELDEENAERIVRLKHLRSLCLNKVHIEDETLLERIISSYPLIETLDVEGYSAPGRLGAIELNDLHNIKYLSLKVIQEHIQKDIEEIVEEKHCSVEIYPPSLETLYIDIPDCSICFNKEADFLNLSVLYLCAVKSSLEHLSSCKFPRLKSLTLQGCDGLKEIHLYIDAPNITYFEYKGYFIPSISFATTTSSQWRSQIELTYWDRDGGSSRFLKLHELLKSLRQSEISLNINYDRYAMNDGDILIQDNNGCIKPVVVESLGLSCDLFSFPSLVNGLFVVCRPRNIYNYSGGDYSDNYFEDNYSYNNYSYNNYSKHPFVGFMWKILMERDGGKIDKFTHLLLLRDLEEVSFEMKDGNLEEEWHQATLSDFLVSFGQKVRFALKWRETP